MGKKAEARFFAYIVGEFQGMRDLIAEIDQTPEGSQRERLLIFVKEAFEDIYTLTRPVDPFEEDLS